MAASSLKLKAAWALSALLLCAGSWDFYEGAYVISSFCLLGFVLGLSYCLRGGSLPGWAHSELDVGYDDDPSNVPSKYAIPLLILFCLGVFFLGSWLVFKLLASPF